MKEEMQQEENVAMLKNYRNALEWEAPDHWKVGQKEASMVWKQKDQMNESMRKKHLDTRVCSSTLSSK